MSERKLGHYERQLTSAELRCFYNLLFQDGLSLLEVQAQIPAWKDGARKDQQPCVKTLVDIRQRLIQEGTVRDIRMTAGIMSNVKEQSGNTDLGRLSSEMLDTICSLLGQQILGRVNQNKAGPEDNDKLRIILKREDQRLAQARFMRETCRHFLQWYKNERVREIARSRDSNADKIEKLGKYIYGDKW